MTGTDAEQLLREAQAAYESGAEATQWWRKLHALAEAQDASALAFFVACLDSDDWDWRLNSLECLGFHYPLQTQMSILDKIRELLLHDPSEMVRHAAAAVLGSQRMWPDHSLVMALKTDASEYVRQAAFDALLTVLKVPFKVVRQEVKRVKQGEIAPSLDEVKRILAENGISVSDLGEE